MKLFLRMKHLQLCCILIFSLIFSLLPSLFSIFYFLWIMAISINVKNIVPRNLRIVSLILYSVIGVAILFLILNSAYTYYLGYVHSSNSESSDASNLFGTLLAKEFFIYFYVMPILYISFSLTVAKLFKSAEQNTSAKFNEYAGDFFMFLFSIIGVWILQPRINKMFSKRLPPIENI